MKVSIGFCIRRSMTTTFPRGKTMCAYPHKVYETSDGDDIVGDLQALRARMDRRYVYDVAEVFMEIGDAAGGTGDE